MMRMVMHMWTAKQSEVMKNPAIRELAGYNLYSYAVMNPVGMMDKVFDMEGLKVFVDATSLIYLNGCNLDYVETLEGAGFKFENPNVKSTCGCGSSFNV